MDKTYFEFLVNSYNTAVDKFEEAKKEAIKEIERMNVVRAEEFGAAYASRVEQITVLAGQVSALSKSITAYQYFDKENIRFTYDEDRHIVIFKIQES